VLADKAYSHNLIELLDAARNSIDVCMFYIALPAPEHPTRRLLDALAKRAAKGCKVRVLVDQDGKDDPYGSRLINAGSVQFLAAHGVETRGDATESLLHSKFVVIDRELVVIGSHNWTAGSFFNYSDLSVVISGRDAGKIWIERFERVWSRAGEFNLAPQ
jgi:phosphatidylserine/phosphatidylglycerophosphate/cardiolipin synthase-like enzyme